MSKLAVRVAIAAFVNLFFWIIVCPHLISSPSDLAVITGGILGFSIFPATFYFIRGYINK